MPTYKQRSLANKSQEFANDTFRKIRDDRIAEIEALRTKAGLSMSGVDSLVGEGQNWYYNRCQGNHGHDFNVAEYDRLKRILEIEILRDLADLSPMEIGRRFSPDGPVRYDKWYEKQITNGISLLEYERVRFFLELLVIQFVSVGYIEMAESRELIELGIIKEDDVPKGTI